MTQRDQMATVRVATWNILHGVDLRHGTVDLAAVADAVRRLDADVVGLQEVDRELGRSGGADQAAEIAQRLGWSAAFAPALAGDPDVAWCAPRGGDPAGAAYGVALLSRLPVRDVARIALPGGGDGRRPRRGAALNPGWDREPRVAVRATVEIGGTRAITVVTTHLSYLPWRGLRQLRRVDGAVPPGPAVLMGDFNLPPRAVALLSRGWTPAGGAATYPAPQPRVQVDHVLVRGLQVAAVRVGEAATSDHHPVVADLRLP